MGRLSDSITRVDLATSLLDYAKELEAEFPAHVVALEKAIVILQKCEALNPELKPFVKEHDLVLKVPRHVFVFSPFLMAAEIWLTTSNLDARTCGSP